MGFGFGATNINCLISMNNQNDLTLILLLCNLNRSIFDWRPRLFNAWTWSLYGSQLGYGKMS